MVNLKHFLKKKRQYLIFILITSLVVVIDQLTKWLVLRFNPKIDLKLLSIHLVKNTGAGFGILKNQTLWLGLFSLLIVVGIIYFYKKIPSEKTPQILTATFLGGAIGNLIDRLFRGHVIDFIDFDFWPAFNIADSCLTIAAIGLVIYFWKK
jgi:signal peptidase II